MEKQITTEQRNPATMSLDTMTAEEIVSEMNREDHDVVNAVNTQLPAIARAAEYAAKAIRSGGRLIYIGAGTSGRLGVLDASECPPTFGVSPETVVGVIAGGPSAVTQAAEGAEDDRVQAAEDLKRYSLSAKDFVVGIAASGRTPYVIAALQYAHTMGCQTAAVSCTQDARISKEADIAIEAVTGPEILTGSTRLKAGTATKMILNMISTAAMVRLGKAYGNLMVDVVPSNEKLRMRAVRIVSEAAEVSYETAQKALQEAGGSCKKAITALLCGCGPEEAEERLQKADGYIRRAVQNGDAL
ncbi:MAG: N-acetylmuramic acid 6-phosphate etherase [Solobacterium sp.]|nr:N-acetylmuramic acid 6-phosphate etherase [Solobacterium sp.]